MSRALSLSSSAYPESDFSGQRASETLVPVEGSGLAGKKDAFVSIFIPGEPVPFARSRFTPKKQRNQMAVARMAAEEAMKRAEHAPFEGPVSLSLRATFPVPASWSKKKRDLACWKTSKPDLDNLIKLVKDAFNSIVWVDDAQVCEISARKVYGLPAGVTVVVMNAEDGVIS